MIPILMVKPLSTCALLWGLESPRLSNDGGLTAQLCEVETLILVAWSFQFDESTIEERQDSINNKLEGPVERILVYWMNVVDVAGDTGT